MATEKALGPTFVSYKQICINNINRLNKLMYKITNVNNKVLLSV